MDNKNSINESLFGFDDTPKANESTFTYGNATIPTNQNPTDFNQINNQTINMMSSELNGPNANNNIPPFNGQMGSNISSELNNANANIIMPAYNGQMGNNINSELNNPNTNNNIPAFNSQLNNGVGGTLLTNDLTAFNNNTGYNSNSGYNINAGYGNNTGFSNQIPMNQTNNIPNYNTPIYNNNSGNVSLTKTPEMNNNFAGAQNQYINATSYVQPVIQDPDKNAKKLCIISLCLYFGIPILSGIFDLLLSVTTKSGSIVNIFGNALSVILGLGPLAGIVLMIICRVNYPQNKFGKVLMWLYIGLFILGIIGTILVAVFLMATCTALFSEL